MKKKLVNKSAHIWTLITEDNCEKNEKFINTHRRKSKMEQCFCVEMTKQGRSVSKCVTGAAI